eukprot:13426-Heterococcus_DN1.PRE.2
MTRRHKAHISAARALSARKVAVARHGISCVFSTHSICWPVLLGPDLTLRLLKSDREGRGRNGAENLALEAAKVHPYHHVYKNSILRCANAPAKLNIDSKHEGRTW